MKTECNDEIEINGEIFIKKLSLPILAQKNNKKCVLIRSYDAGVHFGFLEKEENNLNGKTVVLSKTRRAYYWDGAASLSQMALEGVNAPDN